MVTNIKHPASKSITDSVPNQAKKSKATKSTLKTDGLSRKVATVAQKVEVIEWYHANGRNQSKMAKHFDAKWPELGVKQPKVSDWVKKEKDI